MVLQARDVFSIAVEVGHHEDAKRGKQAGEQCRMGSANKAQEQVQVKPSLLLAQGEDLVGELTGDKAIKMVFRSTRFGTVAEVGMPRLAAWLHWCTLTVALVHAEVGMPGQNTLQNIRPN